MGTARSTIRRYTILGALFGICFPLIATVIKAFQLPSFSWAKLFKAHVEDPMLMIIDLAPFVLGLIGYLLGRNRAALESATRELERTAVSQDARLVRLDGQLEQRNDDLNSVTYAAAHDLRSALRGIASCISFIREEEDDMELDQLNKMLDGRVERMEHLLDGLMRYIRLVQSESVPVKLDLNEMVNSAASRINDPRLKLELDQPCGELEFDEEKCIILFEELFSNSVKFTQEDTVQVRVSCKHRGTYMELSVSDNGPGVPAQYRDRIFRMFTTLQSRDELESTGLGLAIVQRIVSDAGGKVVVGDGEGSGLTVIIQLPT